MTATNSPALEGIHRFGRYELRPAERVLLADGAAVKLGGRAFDLLVVLAERYDRIVSKSELLERVWPQLVVEENNLQAQVVALRKLLGPAAIATVPGRGYRLMLSMQADHRPAAGLAWSQRSDADAGREQPQRHNLPRSTDALIGRERELRELQALVAVHRLVTVAGPGGVGKSRVVIESGWNSIGSFADGVWLVELAALADASLVPSAITSALGIAIAQGVEPLAELTRQLGERRALLILDNCEHVIAAVASALEALLSATPNVHVLVSSQEVIGIGGEHVLRLPSLAVPEESNPSAGEALATSAVQLFVARARAADRHFVFDDRAAKASVDICRRLDGIPLALEMAAARVPLLGADGIAGRLDERFRVLTAGRRTALPRQRTLRATLDWSFGLLSASEQAVFRRLAVFAGPFTIDAAAAVAGDGGIDSFAVIEDLAGLCDKSLVVVVDGGGEAIRYRLLETARAYALERLADAGETADAAARHALQLQRYFAPCFDDWSQLSDAAFHARYAPEIDNLRAAIAWAFGRDGDADTAIALVGASIRVWVNLSLFAEAQELVQRALRSLAPSTPPALEADLRIALTAIHSWRNHEEIIRAAHRAVELYRALGDAPRLACALHALAHAHAYRGDDEAEPVLDEARAVLQGVDRPRLQALLHQAFALTHTTRGRVERATHEALAALRIWRAAGAEGKALQTLNMLADLAWQQRDLDRAIGLARDALEQLRRLPFCNRLWRVYAAGNLFGMLVERGDSGEALALWRELLPEVCDLKIAHGWSDHYASYLACSESIDTALRLVGWGDAMRESRSLRRQPNEQRARDTVITLARAHGADCSRLLAEGAALTDGEVHRLALP